MLLFPSLSKPAMSSEFSDHLIEQLVQEAKGYADTDPAVERNCWLAVHRHAHGVLPSEYDIREIPEDLYLAVLERARAIAQATNP
ncbi:hypothetical protein syc0170_d [Synechococcus elongatus PCC 6301]|nr:hypothetical protein syc0170_d [Synechococcus elongatus PCC 6301]